MNNYAYFETSVKRKETIGTYAIRVLMILAAIIAFFVSFYNIVTFIIGVLVIIAMFYFFPQLKVEYEYVYVDGQLDFDKILGGNKRKRDLRIEFEQVEMMAPEGSNELDRFSHLNLKTKNYTSREEGIKPYVIIYTKGDTGYRILFEPSEEMVQGIKQKTPRKISEF